MADSSVVVDHLPSSIPNPNNSSADFDSLPIPPLDPQFFASDSAMPSDNFISDLDFAFEDNCDFELTFDDLDNLYLPSETEDFLIPDAFDPASSNGAAVLSPESGSSTVSGGKCSHVVDFLNYPSPENSADRHHSDISNIPSPDREFSGEPLSSQGSGVSEGLNSPSHSGNSDRDISSKVKLEEIGKSCMSKRKKEEAAAAAEEEGNAAESRTTKYRRSSAPADNANSHFSLNGAVVNEEDEKRKARLMRNRESAQLSRQRKKHYVDELEDKVRSMHSTITDLNGRISYIMAENATLRQQLSGGAMCPPPGPPPGMYPHPPMAYPWMPCTPYIVKPQGSQVPLVPIPRLKPQPQPNMSASASKGKKSEGRKTEGKTKKVASISFLGLLFFVLLFGGLVPIVNVNFGGLMNKVPIGSGYVSERFYDHHRGRVLTVSGHMNGSEDNVRVGISKEKFDGYNRIHHERQKEQKKEWPLPGSDEFVRLGNASEPLVASLYVPRNDKLVKIDGNLIIHSILASEKATASHAHPEVNNNYALAIPKAGGNRGRRAPLYSNPTKRQKALASGAADALKDHLKSTAADGKLQQWFREGLAGPMLSSGMCTEVFQFDVSSASGAIIPASSASNVTAEQHKNTTRLNKGKNRRTLHNLPAPFAGSNNNITEDHVKRNLPKDNFQGNRSVSSMVVSVLVDPREGSESDVDGVITPKSLSRIFVVVLIDSVKYVTYSCVLPRATGLHHLVTT